MRHRATVCAQQPGPAVMEIFIGNIPYDTTADELEGLLAPLLNCAGFAWLFTADGASAQHGLDGLITA